MFQHWHPLCASRSVRRKPVSVRLGDRGLVVFRTSDGVGVLDDSCPHRRMKLSCGSVRNDCIVCPYHGWTFDKGGAGASPGTPRLHTQAPAFEVVERAGYVWARSPGSQTTFPQIEADGFAPVRPVEQLINAPLELVLDNFTEVEHAATVHKYIGYDLSEMHRVQSIVTARPNYVRVENSGPQKRVPSVVRKMFGVPRDAEFHWEWVTRFSPVHTIYDEFWTLGTRGREIGVRGRICAFFCPVDEHTTRLVLFPAFRLPWSNAFNTCCLWFREIARQMVRFEIAQDARMIDQLADTNIEIEGMKLSRFDRTLGLHRERIEKIYRASAATETSNIASRFSRSSLSDSSVSSSRETP